MGTDIFPEWISTLVSVGIGGFLWRYIARKEERADQWRDHMEARFDRIEAKTDERFDRIEAKTDERFDRAEAKTDERFDRAEAKTDERADRTDSRIEGVAREVVKNGRAIARIEGRHEGHPVAVAE